MEPKSIQKFQAGDVVQLKSGGPEMTIEMVMCLEWDPPEKVCCVWFAGDVIFRDRFSWYAVQKVSKARE
ncbi:MAG: YodC family protein [Kofleriaceae bacterium]